MTETRWAMDSIARRLPDAILVTDATGRIVDANDAALRLVGRSYEDLRGSSLATLAGDGDAAVKRLLRLCVGGTDPVPGSLVLRLAAGDVDYRCEGALLEPPAHGRPALVYLRLIPRNRASQRFRLLTRQIDDLGRQVELRLRAERVLEAQRRVLEMIAEETPLAEVLEALTGLIEEFSPAGVRASVLLLEPRGNVLRHGAAPSLPAEYCRAIDGLEIGPAVGSCGTAAYLNEIVCTPDIGKDPKWEGFTELAFAAGLRACMSTPVTGTDNEVLGTFALYYSEPRAPDPADTQIVSLLSRTAGIAIERCRAAAERRELLARERAARSEAEEANRSKDEFLAMVSHELRNPLNAISGWADVITMEGVDDATVREGLEAIERNASLQAQLINEILDYSRIKAGKLRLDIEPTDLAAVVRVAVRSARPDADAKGIRLQLESCDAPQTTALDPARMQQVVSNLLSNAIKFTPRGGTVVVRLGASDDHLHLVVEDTGCGIDSRFLPYVFERFRQQDASARRAHDGLGLGLAIVRHVVEMHHGRITASSEGRGKGARFEVILPRRFSWTHKPVSDEETTPDLDGVKVLAVDDSADTRAMLKTLFSAAGAQVEVAAAGDEALDCLRSDPPDVLLCDIGMPGMDGYEVLQRLRGTERRVPGRRIPAIALTAFAAERDRTRALDAGFDSHMAKPIDAAALLRLVAEYSTRD